MSRIAIRNRIAARAAWMVLSASGLSAWAVDAAGCGDNQLSGSDARPPVEIAIASVSPAHGPLAGGTEITITGSGLAAGMPTVVVGDRVTAQVAVTSDGALVVTTPPGDAPGAVDVAVFNDSGAGRAAGAFAYNAPPAAATIDPPAVDWNGGETVRITGSGFADADAGAPVVRFGGVPATGVTVVDDAALDVVVPAAARAFSRVDVTVETGNGSAAPVVLAYVGRGLLAAAPQRGDREPAMVFIEPDTGVVQELGNVLADGFIATGLWGMATDADGRIVGITATTFGKGFGPRLVSVDPFPRDGVVDAQVVAPISGNVFCNAVTFARGVLYCGNRREFFTLDTETGFMAQVAPPGPNEPEVFGGGLAVADDGTVYNLGRLAVGTFTTDLFTVDLASGTRRLPSVPVSLDERVTAAAVSGGGLYVLSVSAIGAASETHVSRIDPVTTAVTPIATLQGYFHSLTHTGP